MDTNEGGAIFSPRVAFERVRAEAAEDKFGYFGTLREVFEGGLCESDAEVAEAVGELARDSGEASEFLRSRMGRHLADAVATKPALAGKTVYAHAKECLDWFRLENGRLVFPSGRARKRAPDLVDAASAALELWLRHGLGDTTEETEAVFQALERAIKTHERRGVSGS